MPSDLEWLFSAGGGLQLVDDAKHAGAGSVTLGVDAELVEVAGRGLEVPQAQTVPSGQFRLAMLQDPDGNNVVPRRSPDDACRQADRVSATRMPPGERPR